MDADREATKAAVAALFAKPPGPTPEELLASAIGNLAMLREAYPDAPSIPDWEAIVAERQKAVSASIATLGAVQQDQRTPTPPRSGAWYPQQAHEQRTGTL